MNPEDREICLCFHVPLNKLARHHRLHAPSVASQMAECHGAGTGCGWCVPFLEKMFEQMNRGEAPAMEMPAEEYRRRRLEYHRAEKPVQPPSPDAEQPLELDLEQVLAEVPDDMKLD